MGNNFTKLSIPALTQKAANVISIVIETPTDYGVTTSQCEIVEAAREQLETSASFAEQANAAKLSAFATQDMDKQELLSTLSDFTKLIYATNTVTDAELLKAGLAPRPSRSNRPLIQPSDLVADEMTYDRVSLKWSRAGNPTSAVFVVETRGEDTDWTAVGQFSKTRIVLENFTAGVPAYFRVVAVRNNVRSLPSNEAVVYGELQSSSLQAA